jgi:hypothetical protein
MMNEEELMAYLGERGIKRNKSELMILGNGPTRGMGQLVAGSADVDVWGINSIDDESKIDVLFNIHGDHVIRGRFEDGQAGCMKYQDMSKPIVMQHEWDEYPSSVRFPISEMVRHFGSTYTANTIPYMIWLGWWLGYTAMHFYGVDYWNALRVESLHERPCTEYWMGRYEQSGGMIKVPPESHLLTGFNNPREMYGYEVNPQMGIKERTRNWEA